MSAERSERAKYIDGRLPYESGDPPAAAPVTTRDPKASKGLRHAAIDDAICTSKLRPTLRLVLFALNRRIGWTRRKGRPAGTCHVSLRRITADSGLCERAVRKALRDLEAAHWLLVTSDPEHRTPTYRITPPQG
jgi:hypothetical protein